MKVGIIGLGDIAQKAYLPLLHKKGLELHLHTRNETKLRTIAQQYRVENYHLQLDSLLQSGISAAFVHSPTDTHEYLVERLLSNGIHVFVDKPVTYDYKSTSRLIALAKNKKLILKTGFNRRYAAPYQKLKEVLAPNMILMQKNRNNLPDRIRKFIFDDFVHVVDTLIWLLAQPIEQIAIAGRKKDGLLYHATIQLTAANGTQAIGIMNRDTGTTEEIIEVFSSGEKRLVHNFSDVIVRQPEQEIRIGTMNWDTTLHRRGFELMIDTFLSCLSLPVPVADTQDDLLTHKICEQVVEKLEELK